MPNLKTVTSELAGDSYCFQSTIGTITEDLRPVLLQRIDDLLFHGESPESLLKALRTLLQTCRSVGLKLTRARDGCICKTTFVWANCV